MKKMYIYQEGFLTEIDVNKKSSIYVSEESNVENDSDLIYIPTKFRVYNNENEVFNELSNVENKSKYLKNQNLLYSIDSFNSSYYIEEIEVSTLNYFKNKEKNVRIYSIIDLFVQNIGFNNLIKYENLENVFLINVANEENIVFQISYENNNLYINEIKKLGDNEINNYFLDLKRKKDKLNKYIKLYTNTLTEDLKNIFYVKDFDNVEDSTFKEFIKSPELYSLIEANNLLNIPNKESNILLANNIYVEIQNKKIKNWLFSTAVLAGTIVSSYLLLFSYSDYLHSKHEADMLEQQNILNSKINEYYLIDRDTKRFRINSENTRSDYTRIPFIITYLEKMGLKVIGLKTTEKVPNPKGGTDWVVQILVKGNIPNDLMKYMKKNLALKDYDIKDNVNQYSDGQAYVMNFNLSEFNDKNLKGDI